MEPLPPVPGSSIRPRPCWRRVRRALLLYIITPYLAVTLIFAVFQRQLLYRPTKAANLHLAGDAGIDVQLRTPDGATLRGWLLSGRAGQGKETNRLPLVLYFPGNSLNRKERLSDLREIASHGFDVLIFDYRGYGDSSGSPSEARLSADARQIWNYATGELGCDAARIVVFGESLGGAVALSLWSPDSPSPPKPAALVLSSTFASLPQTVAWHYPLFPFQYLLLDRWPSLERISRVNAPVVVFHGADDDFVPIEQGRQLARAARDGRFVEIPGGTHNEIPVAQLHERLSAIGAVMRTTPEN